MFKLKTIDVGIELICNVSVLGTQHSVAVLNIRLRLLYQILFPYRVPCAVQQVLVDFVFYIYIGHIR